MLPTYPDRIGLNEITKASPDFMDKINRPEFVAIPPISANVLRIEYRLNLHGFPRRSASARPCNLAAAMHSTHDPQSSALGNCEAMQ